MNGPKLIVTVSFAMVTPCAGLSGQRRDHCLMARSVSGHPGIRERVAGDHFPNLSSNEALHPARHRSGQRMQWVGYPRRQPALGERIHSLVGDRLHIEVHEDLGSDLVCDGILNRGIARERCDGRHVTIGIGDQVFRPYGNPCKRAPICRRSR